MEENMKQDLHTTSVLFEKIKEFEGLRLKAYKCPAGFWTIGYGHTEDVKRGDKISKWCADEFLRQDIAYYERMVLQLNVCTTHGQLDALVDFAFNLGTGSLRTSTLLKLIRAGASREVITKEFMKWVHAGKQVLPGLVKRRAWEVKRFFEKDINYLDNYENNKAR